VELEYVVQDEEEERDRVAEELYRRDAILQVRAAAAAAGVKRQAEGGHFVRSCVEGEGARRRGGLRRVEEEGESGGWTGVEEKGGSEERGRGLRPLPTADLEEEDARADDGGIPRDSQQLEHDDVSPLDDHEGARVDQEAWW
jgi:hypothetical protein